MSSFSLDEADNIVKEIIKTKNTDDIRSLIEGYAYATHGNVYKMLEEILSLNEIVSALRTDIMITLRSHIHINQEKAVDILQRLERSNPIK